MRNVFQQSAIRYSKKRQQKINQAASLNVQIRNDDSTDSERRVHKDLSKHESNQILPENSKGPEVLPAQDERRAHRKTQLVVQESATKTLLEPKATEVGEKSISRFERLEKLKSQL